jgi:endonuclease/exonuclease/phosphatase family metal-dependent hydrolase
MQDVGCPRGTLGCVVTGLLSILPWRSCGIVPWGEGAASEKTKRALDQLIIGLPVGALVWGGDWNHSMRGREYTGSVAGRTAIMAAVANLQLTLATEDSPHRIPGLLTIDHIAVPQAARIHAANRIVGDDHTGKRLSDHDAYTIEVTVP